MRQLSSALQGIYALEIALSNEVVRIEEPAGSNCPLAVIFQNPLHFERIRSELQLPASVRYWENHDAHYSLEAGYFCERTRHSIAGPLPFPRH